MSAVHDPLEEAKAVLNDLERNLEKDKSLWNSFRELNPHFEQVKLKQASQKARLRLEEVSRE